MKKFICPRCNNTCNIPIFKKTVICRDCDYKIERKEILKPLSRVTYELSRIIFGIIYIGFLLFLGDIIVLLTSRIETLFTLNERLIMYLLGALSVIPYFIACRLFEYFLILKQSEISLTVSKS